MELLRTKEKALLKIYNMVVYYGYIPDADVYIPDAHVPEQCVEPTVESFSADSTSSTKKSKKSVDKNVPRNGEKAPQAAPKNTSNGTDTSKISKTIYVVASHSKSLTGKKGRKKKDLVDRSGAGI